MEACPRVARETQEEVIPGAPRAVTIAGDGVSPCFQVGTVIPEVRRCRLAPAVPPPARPALLRSRGSASRGRDNPRCDRPHSSGRCISDAYRLVNIPSRGLRHRDTPRISAREGAQFSLHPFSHRLGCRHWFRFVSLSLRSAFMPLFESRRPHGARSHGPEFLRAYPNRLFDGILRANMLSA